MLSPHVASCCAKTQRSNHHFHLLLIVNRHRSLYSIFLRTVIFIFIGFYLSRDNCLPCSPGCASCKRTDQCSACRHPYVLHGKNISDLCLRTLTSYWFIFSAANGNPLVRISPEAISALDFSCCSFTITCTGACVKIKQAFEVAHRAFYLFLLFIYF